MHLVVRHVILDVNTVFVSLATTLGHSLCSEVRRLSSQTDREIMSSQPWQTFGTLPTAKGKPVVTRETCRQMSPAWTVPVQFLSVWQTTVPVPWPGLSQSYWGKWKTYKAIGSLEIGDTPDTSSMLLYKKKKKKKALFYELAHLHFFFLLCLPRHAQRCRNSYLRGY